MLLVVFDPAYELLGEVMLHDGRVRTVTLLPSGESRLGNYFEMWQTVGIPFKRTLAVKQNHVDEQAYIMDRIPFHTHGCHEALRAWLREQGFLALDVHDACSDCWKRLSQLPLNLFERYVFLAALTYTSIDSLTLWRKALEEAWLLFLREQKKTHKAVERLKQQLGTQLVQPFQMKK